MLVLPNSILTHTGPVQAIEQPAQGLNFEVYFLTAARGRFVLKIGNTPEKAAELADEARVLRHLREKAPFVAQPVGEAVQDGQGLFLFTHLEGETLLDALARADVAGRHQLIGQAARLLRQIHAWTPDLPCPRDWLGDALRAAERNVVAGLVPDPIPDRYRVGEANPRVLLHELLTRRTTIGNDLVFGHGDYCLPNILARDHAVAGVVDWSRGGYADRRYDLATTLWSIDHNLGDTAYQDTFLRSYGYAEPVESLRYFEALHALL